MKRQLPGTMPRDEFEAALTEFEAFIGPEWLKSQPTSASPLMEIWNRPDQLASTELFTVADSYMRLAPQTSADWLAEYRKAIRTHNSTAIVSQTYELISAAMFSYKYQAILCEPSAAGYDFTISYANKTIRVSCKKLGLSEGEQFFRRQAQAIYERVAEAADRLATPTYQMKLMLVDQKDRLRPTADEMYGGLEQLLAAYRNNLMVGQRVGSWFVQIEPMFSGPDQIPLDPEYRSHQVICVAPHAQDEQKRFATRFEEAARKLKRCGALIDSDNVNVIMIRVPEAVSLRKVKVWLDKKFSRDNTSITGVILMRPIFGLTEDATTAAFQYEFEFIPNPQAQVPWLSFEPQGLSLEATLPVAQFSETESYSAFNVDGQLIRLGEVYTFQRGQVYLQAPPRGQEARLSFPEAAGIQHYFIERLFNRGAVRIGAIAPPTGDLLLL